jgi:predicted transcriptional regulator
MNESSISNVFAALAHPERRRMLEILRAQPGANIARLVEHFRMSAVGVLKHVRVLERAGLIHSERKGRERKLYFNIVPIQMVHDEWTSRYAQFWAERMVDLKASIEQRIARKGAARHAG